MLEVKNLQVNYGESVIINGVSMSVPSGQVVCLMGRNGVGKTTLLKALMGVLKPRAGSITFDGQDMTKMPIHQRARGGIGYVPQGRGIFPYLTVYENLCMGFESAPGAVIDHARVEELYVTFPVLKQMSRRVAGTLSGGQQQQLAIARALVRRPRLLLLDEPTEGIQPSIMHEIEDVIVSLQQRGDMAILLVEQFVDFALGVAEYYYVMQTGQIVSEGSVKEFQQDTAKEYLAF
ncbi:MAG: urea ABC transporter ATP-binding subunit UrtE [Chloroflexi bacterium]|nr:urea ABC transporter ATP-binding subunit UrtE [Chloroflexota bacterium]